MKEEEKVQISEIWRVKLIVQIHRSMNGLNENDGKEKISNIKKELGKIYENMKGWKWEERRKDAEAGGVNY